MVVRVSVGDSGVEWECYSEEKVRKVVDTKLGLKAILGLRVRRRIDSCCRLRG